MTEQQEITPSALSEYLAGRGWQHTDTWRGAIIWSLDSASRLLVPERREYEDDDELIAEAVYKLAQYEGRSEQDVRLDITDPLVDTQYYRMLPDAPPGTIPITAGLKAVQGIHDLLKTACRTALVGPHLLFEGRRPELVDTFLDQVRLGAARPGSYILTTRISISQIAPATQENLFAKAPNQLSGHDVSRLLSNALGAAHKAAQSTVRHGRTDDFDEALEKGVSANLCNALASLGGTSKNLPFEIGFSWGKSTEGDGQNPPIMFSGNEVTALAQAGRDLEDLAKSGEARIVGEVETLEHKTHQRPMVRIVGELTTTARVVRRALWVSVTESDYEDAFAAQQAKRRVEAQGWLTNTQRRIEMDPQSFRVID